MDDLISRQMAIEAICKACSMVEDYHKCDYYPETSVLLCDELVALRALPSAQLDGIPLEWIDKHLEWLDNCNNDFAQLAKVSIKAMVELWKKDRI